ncbi:rhomboid family intramembrane serine protease [Mechercharimyces sp. CAU 1602]|uniref:rhomboid family intramembrane serine protease n=1 Tax=Mechercharimyces sp. CAU 1602 TaxID=2973933 RepID=UPI0021622FB5|nr:rhomboid family intramembrane serine protease [Mechercharimyces sp. CAU 1602]MCS1350138.1 rhomboid family intramembrane serine protease [Mechercharimyces sp. CAU 1602]
MNRDVGQESWQIVNHLIRKHHFTILQMKDARAIHLIREFSHEVVYARLIPVTKGDDGWKKDLKICNRWFKRASKQVADKKMIGLNIYFFQEAPDRNLWEQEVEACKNDFVCKLIQLDREATCFSVQLAQLFPCHLQVNDLSEVLSAPCEDALEIKERIMRQKEKQVKARKVPLPYRHPIATLTIFFINLLVFLLIWFTGTKGEGETLIQWGAKYNPLVIDGQWWRIISMNFLHLDWLHIITNSIALLFLGILTERLLGTKRFALIYLFAGIGGGIASFAFTPTLSAGSSGAIFGLFGALLFLVRHQHRRYRRVLGLSVVVVFSLFLVAGFFERGVDNAGHIGGLLSGYVCAFLLGKPSYRNQFQWKTAGALVLLAGMMVVAFIGYGEGKESETYLIYQGEQFLDEGEYGEAEVLFRNLIARGTEQSLPYYYLGTIHLQKNNESQAKFLFMRAVQLDPPLPEAYFHLAQIYIDEGDQEQAVAMLQQAIQLAPQDKKLQEMLNMMERRKVWQVGLLS